MVMTKKPFRWMHAAIWLIAGTGALVAVQMVTRFILTGPIVAITTAAGTDVYALASRRAIAAPEVVRALGAPIKASLESARIDGTETTARHGLFEPPFVTTRQADAHGVIRIHLAGSKDQGTLVATAKTSALGWTLQSLIVQTSRASTPIVLLPKKG
jgi:hypothetical protein